MVPVDEEKVVSHMYSCLKDATADTEEFPVVTRIPDGMLKRVDHTNTILITYLQTIDTSVETGVLLAIEEDSKSKCSKKTVIGSFEKQVKESKSLKSPKKFPVIEVAPPKHEVLVADTPLTQIELIPSKIGVFRKIKF